MRILFDEIRRRLGLKDGIRKKFSVVPGVYWDEECARGPTHKGESAPRVGCVERRSHISDVDVFIAVGVSLLAVPHETEVFQEVNQTLLNDGVLKDGNVDFIDSLPQGIIEDDLEEALTKLKPIEPDF